MKKKITYFLILITGFVFCQNAFAVNESEIIESGKCAYSTIGVNFYKVVKSFNWDTSSYVFQSYDIRKENSILNPYSLIVMINNGAKNFPFAKVAVQVIYLYNTEKKRWVASNIKIVPGDIDMIASARSYMEYARSYMKMVERIISGSEGLFEVDCK